jgi:hypothetical protein
MSPLSFVVPPILALLVVVSPTKDEFVLFLAITSTASRTIWEFPFEKNPSCSLDRDLQDVRQPG